MTIAAARTIIYTAALAAGALAGFIVFRFLVIPLLALSGVTALQVPPSALEPVGHNVTRCHTYTPTRYVFGPVSTKVTRCHVAYTITRGRV